MMVADFENVKVVGFALEGNTAMVVALPPSADPYGVKTKILEFIKARSV